MKKLSFSVHAYAPELNRIFLGGVDVSNKFPFTRVDKSALSKDYAANKRLVRAALNYTVYPHYIHVKLSGITNSFTKEFGGGFDNWPRAYELIKERKQWFTDGCTIECKFSVNN